MTKAQPGSGITLITDSKGLNVDSSKAADKNLASATLNALANKLFYTAYKNGETNLAGKVEIAEGLTSSSLSKRMEDVTFKELMVRGSTSIHRLRIFLKNRRKQHLPILSPA